MREGFHETLKGPSRDASFEFDVRKDVHQLGGVRLKTLIAGPGAKTTEELLSSGILTLKFDKPFPTEFQKLITDIIKKWTMEKEAPALFEAAIGPCLLFPSMHWSL